MTTRKSIQSVWRILNILLLIIVVYFSYSLKNLNLIADKKIMVVQFSATIFCICIEVIQERSENDRAILIARISTVILSISFIFASIYVCEMKINVDKVMENIEEYDHIVLATRIDGDINNINDMAKYKIGTQTLSDANGTKQAKDKIESELKKNIETKEYENIITMASALLNKEIDIMIYNNAYLSFVTENDSSFENKIKIIREYKIPKEKDNTLSSSNLQQSVDNEINFSETNNDEINISVSTDNTVNNSSTSLQIDVNQEKIQYIEGKDTMSIYISGIDVYGEIGKTSRSDVNIFAIINPNTRQILLVTTPRDYFVQIPNISGDKKDKLTHAGIYGVDASMNTLENIYDMKLDYYLRVNFTSVEEIVDALGGITVYSEYPFTMGNGYEIKKGYNRLDGVNALRFCRQRYNLPGGDNQRGKNQMEVIKAVAKKVTGASVLLNANKLLETIQGNVDMNVPYELIQRLIKEELSSASDWEIKMMAAEGTDSKAETYSAPGTELYVMEPNLISLYNIKNEVVKIEKGEVLEDVISLDGQID